MKQSSVLLLLFILAPTCMAASSSPPSKKLRVPFVDNVVVLADGSKEITVAANVDITTTGQLTPIDLRGALEDAAKKECNETYNLSVPKAVTVSPIKGTVVKFSQKGTVVCGPKPN